VSENTTALRLGQKVPDFELETYDPVKDDFGKIHLQDQITRKRWTILFFYPADFTFVCATEFAALAENYEKFQKQGCDIFTVSTDTKFTHLAWKKNEKELADVRYPMAADKTGKVGRMFGVYEEGSGLTLRGTFIINPEGVLLSSEINFFNLGRNIEELVRKFKANVYLAGKPNEVCPAKWQKDGDKTLVNPGAKMVGKVHEALNR
jgi:peroxiredoxin (alkyl hydroperoxide reductase subunit C)